MNILVPGVRFEKEVRLRDDDDTPSLPLVYITCGLVGLIHACYSPESYLCNIYIVQTNLERTLCSTVNFYDDKIWSGSTEVPNSALRFVLHIPSAGSGDSSQVLFS